MMKYGLFVYDRSNDVCFEDECEYFTNKARAVKRARRINKFYPELWVEVWAEDSDGLWGNSGEAIYNSY